MISENIKILRRINSLNQKNFAKSIGVSIKRLSNWENGIDIPSLEMIIKIADTFKTSTDFILGRSEYYSVYTKGLKRIEISHLRHFVQDLLARSNPDNE